MGVNAKVKAAKKSKNISELGEIVLYQSPGGKTGIDVHLKDETIWLSQFQMVELFERDQSVIARHIRNIFAEEELESSERNMQKMHIPFSDKPVVYYSLDMIISVGYRVNSKRGTQFRIWATNVLRDHLVRGYTANERRLKELRQSLHLVEQVLDRHDVTSDEAKALLHVVTDYTAALDLLDDYDHQRETPVRVGPGKVKPILYEEALEVVERLRKKFGASDLFGREKDSSLHSSLNAIMQTFGGKDLYPSKEEKAAQLIYFLVKNHSFVDGNKRIAAALFLWFMEKNGLLYRKDGTKRIADNALVAMTLLIAESAPKEKKNVVNITIHLIDKKNR